MIDHFSFSVFLKGLLRNEFHLILIQGVGIDCRLEKWDNSCEPSPEGNPVAILSNLASICKNRKGCALFFEKVLFVQVDLFLDVRCVFVGELFLLQYKTKVLRG